MFPVTAMQRFDFKNSIIAIKLVLVMCYVMMFVSYCVFHNICILLDVVFEFQITADLLCLAAY